MHKYAEKYKITNAAIPPLKVSNSPPGGNCPPFGNHWLRVNINLLFLATKI